MGGICFLNGKFLPEKEAKVAIWHSGILCGFGLFETMRSYRNKIVYLNEHIKRIEESCRLVGLKFPYSRGEIISIILKAVLANRLQDACVRLTLFKAKQQADVFVTARKYERYPLKKYKKGFTAGISRLRQNEDSLLTQLKTTSRMIYELSFQEARDKGFDESIIQNSRGFIAEASRSNIFFVRDIELFTPSLESGCLNGITRKAIIGLAKKENIKIWEGKYSLQDLYNADEAFLTNSLMGVMPLIAVGKKKIGKGFCGRTTKLFINKYFHLLKK